MGKIRVGVVRGGPSSEYEVSLRSGGTVLRELDRNKYEPRDILITKDGDWHLNGFATSPQRLVNEVDVFFNALHGEYGEDGVIQEILDEIGRPYTGSGREASALAMNKPQANATLKVAGFKVPVSLVLDSAEEAELLAGQVFYKLPPPWVIKPADRGSSVGLFLARTFSDLTKGLKQAANFSKNILVEQFIKGKEATVGVINHFRGQEYYVLPPIEIRKPAGKTLWDYHDKYSGLTPEICPGVFAESEKRELERLAALAHQTLGLRHYSRADFIVSPRGIYLLEVNTLPGLTNESLLPKALGAVGAKPADFLDHVISLALK